MNKEEFIGRLRKALKKLPEPEIEKSVMFYTEMIDDRTEEGESEETVLASMGSPEAIAQLILEEMPTIPRAITKSKTGSSVLNWTLIILGAPIWLSLAVAGIAVAFSIYITIWALILTIWILAIVLLLGIPLGLFVLLYCTIVEGRFWVGVAELGAGFVLSGLGVFCLYGALNSSAKLVELSKRYVNKVFSLFRKEKVYEI